MFGENVRRRREEIGWSLDTMAKHIIQDSGVDVSGRMIGLIEQGLRTPSLGLSWGIAKALGCTIDELVESA